MVYSDVVNAGLLLERKDKYTMADVNRVVNNSLFKPYNERTITLEEAIFICKCNAVYHNTTWADSLNKALEKIRSYSFV